MQPLLIKKIAERTLGRHPIPLHLSDFPCHRLIPDDDQHTLSLALLSQKSELNVCHITLLDQADAADFFALHSGDYARNDFYGGAWG